MCVSIASIAGCRNSQIVSAYNFAPQISLVNLFPLALLDQQKNQNFIMGQSKPSKKPMVFAFWCQNFIFPNVFRTFLEIRY